MLITEKESFAQENRVYFLDNLRTFMVFLVVLIHAGGVYESSGGWALFWIVDDPSTNSLSDILFSIIDIFVMPTIFFISGYMAPISLAKKSYKGFIISKFKRLILPWLIAVLTLIPLYKVIYLSSRGLPQETWTTYFHWNCGIWGQNWLWFLPVVFLFNLIYMILPWRNWVSEKISVKLFVSVVFAVGLLNSFVMDKFGLYGFTKTVLINFQNERLVIYLMVFLLGSLCFKRQVFSSKPESAKLYTIITLTSWIPIAIYCFLLSIDNSKTNSQMGFEVFSMYILWLSFHLSLLCMLYLMIETFRRYSNKTGRVWAELNRNSYFVYIVHVIVIGVLANTMLNMSMPSFLKHMILTVVTYLACNSIILVNRKLRTRRNSIDLIFGKEKVMKSLTTMLLFIVVISIVGCSKKEDPNIDTKPTAPDVSLQIAALQGNVNVIRQHIQAGSDLNVKDEYGSTPLIIATTFDKTDAAISLVEGGADLEITNNEGASPLHIAAFFCRTEIVQALLDHGSNKNALNKSGSTALETVSRPFDEVKVVYDHLGKAFKPLGLRLDYERIKKTRPMIVEMLK